MLTHPGTSICHLREIKTISKTFSHHHSRKEGASWVKWPSGSTVKQRQKRFYFSTSKMCIKDKNEALNSFCSLNKYSQHYISYNQIQIPLWSFMWARRRTKKQSLMRSQLMIHMRELENFLLFGKPLAECSSVIRAPRDQMRSKKTPE